MNMNPAMIMKLMQAKNQFSSDHPKFVNFMNMMFRSGIEAGTIVEITVTKPGEEPITSNIRISQSDLDLFNELKDMGRDMR